MSKPLLFLGEEDFLPVMQNEIKKWRKDRVTRGTITSFDGTHLNYYIASPEDPKACIVIVHGFAEFWPKYYEYTWNLFRAGFKVFFMEQRGHGYSEGKCKDPDLIYIDDYSTYVEDLHVFMDKVVAKESDGLTRLVVAHSMGGAVSTLFMEKYPGYFKGALLSSPMMRMRASKTSPIIVLLLNIYMKLFGQEKSIAPNQKRFNPNTPLETSSAKSKPRFEYQLALRRRDDHYQACAATLGWALASLKVNKKLMRDAGKIRIPLTIMTAGDDHLIDPLGYDEIAERIPQAQFVHYENSRHEIFNADEITRKKYYADVIHILTQYSEA